MAHLCGTKAQTYSAIGILIVWTIYSRNDWFLNEHLLLAVDINRKRFFCPSFSLLRDCWEGGCKSARLRWQAVTQGLNPGGQSRRQCGIIIYDNADEEDKRIRCIYNLIHASVQARHSHTVLICRSSYSPLSVSEAFVTEESRPFPAALVYYIAMQRRGMQQPLVFTVGIAAVASDAVATATDDPLCMYRAFCKNINYPAYMSFRW